MALPLTALFAGVEYLRRNPTEILFAAKNAAALRIAVPLDAFRWLAENLLSGKRAPKDVVIGAQPPALTFAGSFDVMGTPLRASAAIRVEEIHITPKEMRLSIRVGGLSLETPGGPASPLGALLASGALDLNKPANLLNFAPKKPPGLVEAKDDRLVFDLLRVPKVAGNLWLRQALEILGPVVTLRGLHTADDHLILAVRPRPRGIPAAARALGGLRARRPRTA